MFSGLNEKLYSFFYKDICLNIIRSVSYTMAYGFYHGSTINKFTSRNGTVSFS